MIRNKYIYLFIVLNLFSTQLFSQDTVIDRTKKQSLDSKITTPVDTYFTNESYLKPIFDKLQDLEKNGNRKINIVHIGDSHIQAGFLTGAIRSVLQDKFGDGGIGFTFPYQLVRTNGPKEIQFVSNVAWDSAPNTRPSSDIEIGLGGFALSTSNKNSILQLSSDSQDIHKIKILYPTKKPQYRMSLSAEKLKVTSVVSSGGKTHRIKSGENLSTIARKYGVTVARIRQANNMKNDRIFAGKVLKIPTNNTVQISNIRIDSSVQTTEMQHHPYYSSFDSNKSLDRVTFLPTEGFSNYTINGLIIENNKPGIIYHSIGVNGAHMSDYNRTPLFFKQLPILQPDLVIISIGTNESFAKMAVDEYMNQMNSFIAQIKKASPSAIVLVMTPPPSLFRRRNNNTYVVDYSRALTSQKGYLVWDLFNNMGGLQGIRSGRFTDLIARDKVHYSTAGYELQGQMFASDFIKSYNNYTKQHK